MQGLNVSCEIETSGRILDEKLMVNSCDWLGKCDDLTSGNSYCEIGGR